MHQQWYQCLSTGPDFVYFTHSYAVNTNKNRRFKFICKLLVSTTVLLILQRCFFCDSNNTNLFSHAAFPVSQNYITIGRTLFQTPPLSTIIRPIKKSYLFNTFYLLFSLNFARNSVIKINTICQNKSKYNRYWPLYSKRIVVSCLCYYFFMYFCDYVFAYQTSLGYTYMYLFTMCMYSY